MRWKAVTTAAILAAAAATGLAITDGELDNGRHPFVGLMIAQVEQRPHGRHLLR